MSEGMELATIKVDTEMKDSGNDTDDEQEMRNNMLIHQAFKNNVKKMQKLLDLKADPNVADYDNRTALHLAASEGKLEAAKCLIDANANPNPKDRFDHTPLDDAVRSGHKDMIVYLSSCKAVFGSNKEHEAALLQAAAVNDVKKGLQLLDDCHVNPDCADYDLRTALHIATADGHLDFVRLLLQHKASVTLKDRFGMSALDEVTRKMSRFGKDPMLELFQEFSLVDHGSFQFSWFTSFFLLLEVIIIVLFGMFCTYSYETNASLRYSMFQDVQVMIFIGFGFLMTFLRKHAFGSVGGTFIIAAFSIQWYILCGGFWSKVFHADFHENIMVTISKLIQGNFAAGAVLITYGVLLGKVSNFQMLMLAFFEVILFALNEEISLILKVTDIGGSMVIHMFGALFGLSASLVLSPKKSFGNEENRSVYHSDLFAMIGTVFLFMFWPSFNAAPAINECMAQRAVMNTVLALGGSCVGAFMLSHVLRGNKFHMVDIQNATLAGGVAIGTTADLNIYMGSAIAIGFSAGCVSVLGYVFLQSWLETKLGLHDTCGVNNLHCMPSFIAAFAGVIAAWAGVKGETGCNFTFPEVMAGKRSYESQAQAQLGFIAVTVAISVLGGFLCAQLVSFIESLTEENLFQDSQGWEVPELEIPYFFDHRGEIERGDSEDDEHIKEEMGIKKLEKWTSTIKLNPVSSPRNSVSASVQSLLARIEVLEGINRKSV